MNKHTSKAVSVLFFILTLTVFSIRPVLSQVWPFSGAVKNVVQCVVHINTYNKTGEWLYSGSGFFVASGKILTCAHVMEDAYSAQVISSVRTYNKVSILKMDEDMDLSLLMINDSGEKHLELDKEQEIVRNQFLIAIGYNYKKHKYFVTYGFVYAIISDRRIQWIFNSTPVYKGWSGGPLLNLEGHVIGVNKWCVGERPYFSGSIGVEAIKLFLSMPDNPVELAYAGSSVSLSVILQKLGGFWGPVLRGIVSIPKGIGKFLFFHGILRGIYIIILAGILISWKSPLLFRYLKAWRRRKAVNKIVKWSDGASYIEDESEIKSNEE